MRDRLTAESPEEREARLQQMRDRLAVESPEERDTRLQQMRDRLTAESPEEREARLQQMRDRLAAESPEERDTRLQQVRDRLAAESPEERDTRLQNMSILQQAVETLKKGKFDCNMPLVHGANREQSLFKQHFVQTKIILHYHFYQLHMHHIMCTT